MSTTGKRRVRSAGTTDRRTAERIANKLEADAALRREGVIDPRAVQFAAAARKTLDVHLADFVAYLANKNNSPKHVEDRRSQLTRLLGVMRATRLADLTPGRVQGGIAELRASGLGLRVLNRYIVALKALSKWLVREGRMESDPLVALSGFRADTDRRRERRALSADEIRRLVAAAEAAPVAFGLSGRDRGMLYRVAAGSGLRAAEIASLTPESFDLAADPPTITLQASYNKRRRRDVQPIRRDLADLLAPWLEGRPAGQPVFHVARLSEKTARMIQRDLKAAGIPYVDEAGRVADLHALRHSYITALVRAGASIKQAQALARHSDPSLTFKVYTHVGLGELRDALDAMPATAETTVRLEMSATEKAG